jgi:beta-alanine degradation protein BauB
MEHRISLQEPSGPIDDPRGNWPAGLQREFLANRFNGAVGNILVSEDARCRVWHLNLDPGAFFTFHRHVLDYFWTAVTAGVARGYYEDGRIQDVHHYPGETRHFKHGPGEYFIHAIENVGETKLIFVTVEFLLSGNPPIVVPDSYRLATRDADAKRDGSSGNK